MVVNKLAIHLGELSVAIICYLLLQGKDLYVDTLLNCTGSSKLVTQWRNQRTKVNGVSSGACCVKIIEILLLNN
jgi:hypothetical protein